MWKCLHEEHILHEIMLAKMTITLADLTNKSYL